MLSREKFKYYINIIKDLEEKEESFRNVVDKLSDGEGGISFIYGQPIITIIDLLCSCFNIDYSNTDNDPISYFIYELDWGKDKMSKDCIDYEDGTKISLTNLDELYDYLLKLEKEYES